MTLIQCCDLSLGYEGKCVLSHLELSVQEGDYLAIVGENGAGKSTLLKGILGLIRPTGGHIHFHLPPKEIGYLPQQTPIQRDFPASVMEVVLSGLLAAKGYAVGKSLLDESKIDYCKDMMAKAEAKGVKLLLPVDVVVADSFPDPIDGPIDVTTVAADAIPADKEGLDIGEKTCALFASAVKGLSLIHI